MCCSVLEAGRTLTLAEKGNAEEITAAPGFRLVATMNPGGDYGKRELSPALANRFTTIWVPSFDSIEELAAILRSHLNGKRSRCHVAGQVLYHSHSVANDGSCSPLEGYLTSPTCTCSGCSLHSHPCEITTGVSPYDC